MIKFQAKKLKEDLQKVFFLKHHVTHQGYKLLDAKKTAIHRFIWLQRQ